MFLSQFQTIGDNLFTRGMVSSESGNLSIRTGDNLVITRRGCRLENISENDLIETGIYRNNRITPLASAELPVHRAIYQTTRAQAIVHAHPPHAVTLSLTERDIVPNPELISEICSVPVIGWGVKVVPGTLEDEIAAALRDHRIVLVRGHGSFAIGQLMEEAYNLTMALEESCQVSCLLKSIR